MGCRPIECQGLRAPKFEWSCRALPQPDSLTSRFVMLQTFPETLAFKLRSVN